VLDDPSAAANADADRMQQLFRFLDNTPSPVFAHVHLMVTHGRRLAPRDRLFPRRSRRDKPWDNDLYDDAIRDFDDDFGQLIDWLKARGRYERSLVIVYSDHGRHWSARERVPLIMRFPGDAPKGRRAENAQLIDVAPTLLEYLGLPIPAWMDGQSLFGKPVSADRPIFFADTHHPNELPENPADAGSKPPFFQLGYVGLARCDYEYSLNVDSGSMTMTRIAGHTRPCTSQPLTLAEARAALLDHLRLAGYDVSGVPAGGRSPATRNAARHRKPSPPRIAATASSSARSFSSWPEWPRTQTKRTRWRESSFSSRSQRSGLSARSLALRFQPLARQRFAHPCSTALTTYCESAWIVTSQGSRSASSAAITARISIRLLVVRR